MASSITRVPDVEPSGKYSAMFLPEHGMERYSQKIGLCGGHVIENSILLLDPEF
jgi:hypothetical protein